MDLKHRSKQLVAGVALAGAVTAGTARIAVAAEGEGDAATPDAPATAEHHPRRALRHAIAGVVTETLGVERAQLREALRGGQSMAEYATSLGQDPQAVADALVAAAGERIDTAVANGRITAERGEELKAKVPERVATLLQRHVGDGRAA